MAYVLTPTDQRGLVVIVATLFMSWMAIIFLIRLYSRISVSGALRVDDLAAGIATVSKDLPCLAVMTL